MSSPGADGFMPEAEDFLVVWHRMVKLYRDVMATGKTKPESSLVNELQDRRRELEALANSLDTPVWDAIFKAGIGVASYHSRLNALQNLRGVDDLVWRIEVEIVRGYIDERRLARIRDRSRMHLAQKKHIQAGHPLFTSTILSDIIKALKTDALVGISGQGRRDKRRRKRVVERDIALLEAACIVLRDAIEDTVRPFHVSYAMAVGSYGENM